MDSKGKDNNIVRDSIYQHHNVVVTTTHDSHMFTQGQKTIDFLRFGCIYTFFVNSFGVYVWDNIAQRRGQCHLMHRTFCLSDVQWIDGFVYHSDEDFLRGFTGFHDCLHDDSYHYNIYHDMFNLFQIWLNDDNLDECDIMFVITCFDSTDKHFVLQNNFSISII